MICYRDPLVQTSFPLGITGASLLSRKGSQHTVVAEMITELSRFEPEICICNEINWNSRENLYL